MASEAGWNVAEAEFDAFYRRTVAKVIHCIYASTGDLTLAQDCAQEAYVRAWQRWEDVSRCDEPLAWIRTVARRLAISGWRRRQAEQRALDQVRTIDPGRVNDPRDSSTDTIAVRAALARVPEALRETLCLYYICDRSIGQIAEELGVPASTIKARLHRGRAALAAQLRGRRDRRSLTCPLPLTPARSP
ncbi:MAG: SigE family RNA polymerase sigma factor [Tetrasphaera sp.]